MTVLRPPALCPGDVLGIISPSSPGAAEYPRRFERGVAEIMRRGFRVKIGHYAKEASGYIAGSVEQRLSDLHSMFADPEVRGIIMTIGGWSSHQLIPHINYEFVAANPKVVIGFSDGTALINAILSQTHMVCFLGPAVLPHWGEFGGILDYTWRSFHDVTCGARAPLVLDPASTWKNEVLSWDIEDSRVRTDAPNPGPRTVRPGSASGPIVGGHTGTLLLLVGTPYWPDLQDAILFLEGDGDDSPPLLDRYLTQLRQMGAMEGLAGLCLGRFPQRAGYASRQLEEIVLRATAGYTFPVVVGLDVGHTDPMMTLPLGAIAELHAHQEPAKLTLLEPATTTL